jgi:Protein of unknown function (DUF2934)
MAKGSAEMADTSVRANTRSEVAKAPEKKLSTKSNGKKPSVTVGRKTITKTTKPTSPSEQAKPPSQTVTQEERWRMVAEAAYLRAEKRGFSGGNPTDDWLAAEAEVDTMLAKR